ncbi:MAG TPA: MarR family transcriptional regulator [Trebonia sp.]|jgi:DNA-binding MarR family transcriptional regulator|nr:MarR family transcriptional regulator [Trebonia sp.]
MDSPTETMPLDALAATLTADLERIFGLFRSLSPPSGLSMTAAATLAGIERLGPQRLTVLAAREGVTQPAMTQLISRLEESGLVRREASPEDGRVVLVVITDEGRAVLARRRSVRSDRMAAIIARLGPEHRAALAIALPALDALASVPRPDDPARAAAR